MKFICIINKFTDEELQGILNNQAPEYVESLKRLYKSFRYVEFISNRNSECMLAVIREDILAKLEIEYKHMNIPYMVMDLTEAILQGDMVEYNFPSNYSTLYVDALPNLQHWFTTQKDDFIAKYSTVDHVLDRISKFGIESLTESDKLILQNV